MFVVITSFGISLQIVISRHALILRKNYLATLYDIKLDLISTKSPSLYELIRDESDVANVDVVDVDDDDCIAILFHPWGVDLYETLSLCVILLKFYSSKKN